MPRMVDCDYVFTTTGRVQIGNFAQAKSEIERKLAHPLAPWRLHDFRRTGVTHLAEMGFDSIVVDKLLAHQPGKLSAVARIYQRHDFAKERAAALDAWAAFVTGLDADNVVALRAAQ